MKILFISDIHGHVKNLDILNKYSFDKLFVLGDLFSLNENANVEVLKWFNPYLDKTIFIKGNCDNHMLYAKYNLRYIEDYLQIKIDNINFYLSHGDKYNYNNLSFSEDKCVVIFGHEHYPYIKKAYDTYYICIGSIALPRYGSMPSFAIYENKTFSIFSYEENLLETIDLM